MVQIPLFRDNRFAIPLALGYLKAMVVTDPYLKTITETIILDLSAAFGSIHSLKRRILSEDPDVVCFSCYVWNIGYTLLLCKEIKSEKPSILTILGGPEVSFRDMQIMSRYPYIDIVVRGEGEQAFVELLRRVVKRRKLCEVNGITFRSGIRVIRNPDPDELNDLNSIPSPYLLGIFDMDLYDFIFLESCRGCIFRCAFCLYHKNFPTIRFFDLKRVEKEIKFAIERRALLCYFIDPTFNIPKRIVELCNTIRKINRNKELSIKIEARGDLLTAKLVKLLRQAGVSEVEVGLESMNPDALRATNRVMDIKRLKEGVDLLKKAGLKTSVNLIVGLPRDTPESVKNTLQFIMDDLQPDAIGTFLLQVLPGTTIREKSRKFGLRFMKNPPYFVEETPTFSKDQLWETFAYVMKKSHDYSRRERTGYHSALSTLIGG